MLLVMVENGMWPTELPKWLLVRICQGVVSKHILTTKTLDRMTKTEWRLKDKSRLILMTNTKALETIQLSVKILLLRLDQPLVQYF